MKKGFTLIEILAVVTIIGLLFVLVIPKITNSLSNKKEDISVINERLIISAAKNYVEDYIDEFAKENSKTYCLPIKTLIKENYLEEAKDITNDKDIVNTKCVKITFENSFKYEIKNKKDCQISL